MMEINIFACFYLLVSATRKVSAWDMLLTMLYTLTFIFMRRVKQRMIRRMYALYHAFTQAVSLGVLFSLCFMHFFGHEFQILYFIPPFLMLILPTSNRCKTSNKQIYYLCSIFAVYYFINNFFWYVLFQDYADVRLLGIPTDLVWPYKFMHFFSTLQWMLFIGSVMTSIYPLILLSKQFKKQRRVWLRY